MLLGLWNKAGTVNSNPECGALVSSRGVLSEDEQGEGPGGRETVDHRAGGEL